MEIRFKERAHYDNLGRNGFTSARGVSLAALRDEVMIEGIGSRGLSSVRIVVPNDHLDELIEALQGIKDRS